VKVATTIVKRIAFYRFLMLSRIIIVIEKKIADHIQTINTAALFV